MARKTLSITSIIMILMLLFTACGGEVNSSNATNSDVYADYTFWENENKIRLFLSFGVEDAMQNMEGIAEDTYTEIPTKYLERIEILKQAMVSYFKEVYNIDISSKLEKQKVKVFVAKKGSANEGTMGYVDPEDSTYLNLNNDLFGKHKKLFDNSYVHESLHQIGFIDKTMLMEGMVDALTDLILRKANIKSYPTDIYYYARHLAYQMIAVDNEIVTMYLKEMNPNIFNHVNKVLENVNQPLKEEEKVAERLSSLVGGLTNGIYSETDPTFVAFEAQEIVRAYCQKFSPNDSTIDYIRSHYIVEEYEDTRIKAHMTGYEFIWNED